MKLAVAVLSFVIGALATKSFEIGALARTGRTDAIRSVYVSFLLLLRISLSSFSVSYLCSPSDSCNY